MAWGNKLGRSGGWTLKTANDPFDNTLGLEPRLFFKSPPPLGGKTVREIL